MMLQMIYMAVALASEGKEGKIEASTRSRLLSLNYPSSSSQSKSSFRVPDRLKSKSIEDLPSITDSRVQGPHHLRAVQTADVLPKLPEVTVLDGDDGVSMASIGEERKAFKGSSDIADSFDSLERSSRSTDSFLRLPNLNMKEGDALSSNQESKPPSRRVRAFGCELDKLDKSSFRSSSSVDAFNKEKAPVEAWAQVWEIDSENEEPIVYISHIKFSFQRHEISIFRQGYERFILKVMWMDEIKLEPFEIFPDYKEDSKYVRRPWKVGIHIISVWKNQNPIIKA